jgi:hypothetical protein
MPPAAKNLFEKRSLDFQKLFIRVILGGLTFFVYLCVPMWLKLGGGSRTMGGLTE